MRFRALSAVVLTALLGATCNLAPALGQDTKKDPPKDPPKEPTKLTEPRWPSLIGGKDMGSWLKDMTDHDPAIREAALRTIAGFGPDVQKAAGKLLVARLTAETDVGVRITLFNTIGNIGFDKSDKNDETEAMRLLARFVDTSGPGSTTRQQALAALGFFGSKAYKQVTTICNNAPSDTSYETRRVLANTLGRIALDETLGPSQKGLVTLSGTLAKDASVSVRMEALQSLVLLGPPWAEVRKSKDGPVPPTNQENADIVANHMRHRLGIPIGPTKLPGVKEPKESPEPDKQLEIWCRVVLMRFDNKEITDANLTAIAKHIDPTKPEIGPRIQALQALAIFGERAASKLDDVMKTLDENDPLVLTTTLSALASMGVKANGAIPVLEKMEEKWKKIKDEKLAEQLKKKDFLEAYTKLKPEEQAQVIANIPEEQARVAIGETIKWIKKSKPGMPGGDPPASTETKKP